MKLILKHVHEYLHFQILDEAGRRQQYCGFSMSHRNVTVALAECLSMCRCTCHDHLGTRIAFGGESFLIVSEMKTCKAALVYEQILQAIVPKRVRVQNCLVPCSTNSGSTCNNAIHELIARLNGVSGSLQDVAANSVIK